MKKLFGKNNLLLKGLFALLLSGATAAGAMAEESSALFVNLKDGSKVQFVLPTQKPEINCEHGSLTVDYMSGDDKQNITFDRDQVESLTVGASNASTTNIATVGKEQCIRFDLTRGAVVRVSGMKQGDRLQVFTIDGKQIQAEVSIVQTTEGVCSYSEATVDLSQQPRGIYMVSVNKCFTFKLMKP